MKEGMHNTSLFHLCKSCFEMILGLAIIILLLNIFVSFCKVIFSLTCEIFIAVRHGSLLPEYLKSISELVDLIIGFTHLDNNSIQKTHQSYKR